MVKAAADIPRGEAAETHLAGDARDVGKRLFIPRKLFGGAILAEHNRIAGHVVRVDKVEEVPATDRRNKGNPLYTMLFDDHAEMEFPLTMERPGVRGKPLLTSGGRGGVLVLDDEMVVPPP